MGPSFKVCQNIMTNSRSRTGDSHRSRKKNMVTVIVIVVLILVLGAIAFVASTSDKDGGSEPKAFSKKELYQKNKEE